MRKGFDFVLRIMFSQTQLLQAEGARLRESINLMKEEREKDALEKERLLNEKEEKFNKEKANLEREQVEFKLQMDERVSTLSSQLEDLQQELDSKQQALSKQNSLVRIGIAHLLKIEYGKAQLRSLQQKVEEATNAAATAQKEREVLSSKNKQLNREVFLLRHVGRIQVIIEFIGKETARAKFVESE